MRQTLKRGRGAQGTRAAKTGFEVRLMVEEEINLHTVAYSRAEARVSAIHGVLLCVGLGSAFILTEHRNTDTFGSYSCFTGSHFESTAQGKKE